MSVKFYNKTLLIKLEIYLCHELTIRLVCPGSISKIVFVYERLLDISPLIYTAS